jgi:hypothetical protein
MLMFETNGILRQQQLELVRRYYDNTRPRAGRGASASREAQDAYLAGIAALMNVEIAHNFPYVHTIEAQDSFDLRKYLDDLQPDWDAGNSGNRKLVLENLAGKFAELASPEKYEQQNREERRKLITEGGQLHLVEQEDREWLADLETAAANQASLAAAAINQLDKVNG